MMKKLKDKIVKELKNLNIMKHNVNTFESLANTIGGQLTQTHVKYYITRGMKL